MGRRRSIERLGMTATSNSVAARATADTTDGRTVETLAVPSGRSFYAPGNDPLTDDGIVPAWWHPRRATPTSTRLADCFGRFVPCS
jgi:hypothetical protein